MKKLIIIIFVICSMGVFGQNLFLNDNNVKIYRGDSVLLEGNLDVNGLLTIGEIRHAAGGFQDSSVLISISVQGDYYQVANATGDLWQVTDLDGFSMSGDTLIVDNAGHYVALFVLTFTGTTNVEYHARIFDVNAATTEGFTVAETGRGSTNYSKLVGAIYVGAETDNDRFVLEVSNESGTQDMTVVHANFIILYLHS